MNKFLGSGRLTKDPEVRSTQTGKTVTSFTIAINDGYGDKQTVAFIPVVTWEKTAENCARYLTKGSPVIVEGKVQPRSYEAQDGTKRYVTEVIASRVEFLSTKSDKEELPNNEYFTEDDSEDTGELPF